LVLVVAPVVMVVAMEIVVLMVDLEVAVASRKLNLFHVLVEHIN
jgi:hypothetical protein|tara:strand:+ start:380 stop:511 length:132 start_codon:yes stop_codon:yes gene_type:complete